MTVGQDAFWFPVRKFDDEVGLWKNFRYLEDFLTNIHAGDKYAANAIMSTSDTNNPLQGHSAYKGDGTADDVQFQAALDDLPSTGGTIFFLDGTYAISANITMPTSEVIIRGSKGTVLSFGDGIQVNMNGGGSTWTGLKITRPAGIGSGFMYGSGDIIIYDNWFDDVECDYVLGNKSLSTFGEWRIINNRFTNIELNKGGVNSNKSAIFIGDEGGSRDANGIFSGNIIDGVTKTDFAGNAHYIVHMQTTSACVAVGNHIKNATVVDAYFDGNVHDSHNMIDEVGVAGDHTGLLVEDLTTASTDVSTALRPDGVGGVAFSDVAHSDLTGVGTDDHHAEAHTIESHSDVTLTAIGPGELLEWSGSAWINQTLAELGVSVTGHTHVEVDVTDLDHTTPINSAIATHAAVTDAHHTRYTDAEAAAKIAADDLYVQVAGDTMTGDLALDGAAPSVDLNRTTTGGGVANVTFSTGGVEVGRFGQNSLADDNLEFLTTDATLQFRAASSGASAQDILFYADDATGTQRLRLWVDGDGGVNLYGVLSNARLQVQDADINFLKQDGATQSLIWDESDDRWEFTANPYSVADAATFITNITGSPMDELSDVALHTPTAGQVLYNNGTNWVVLGIGTATQLLATNAGATAPEWVDAPTGAAFSELMLIGA